MLHLFCLATLIIILIIHALVSFWCFYRKGFIGGVTVVFVAGICSAFSPTYKLLLAFRCLLGFGIGSSHVFASWFLEFIPTRNRGAWSFALSIFWSFGSVVEASLAWVSMHINLAYTALFLYSEGDQRCKIKISIFKLSSGLCRAKFKMDNILALEYIFCSKFLVSIFTDFHT